MHGNTRHGHRPRGRPPTSTYYSWVGMKTRCNNPNATAHDRYQGKLCKRWHRFENFLADMGERPAGKTIERIDNRKGYSLSNCKWATAREQIRNSSTPRITFDDAVEIIVRRMKGEVGRHLAAEFGITPSNVCSMFKGRTWPDAHAKAIRKLNR